jgi:hypothetical protein
MTLLPLRSAPAPDPSLWSTDDLDLAAFLVLRGHPIRRLDPPAAESRRCTAFFDASPALDACVAAWLSSEPVLDNVREYARVHYSVFRWMRSVLSAVGGRR